ncbi:flagellar motor switch phosphatase FliY [Paraliobacillus quinghaiensis]|uniref:Flagellar motor switch phosphatase FliY n=2 Tax=Paraliobacillus quinghaiensis TaxID=470815 RepID=A0A917WQU6_9BACI|nr:flagellar motor switch phosphatase FliY [Paraliobacillus quinghaiensis]
MNDGMLSQDEIDALLKNTDDDQPAEESVASEQHVEIGDILSDIEIDALGEIGNISFGSSATTLSTLLNQKVEITTPTISAINRNQLEDEFPHPHVGVEVQYTEGFEGVNLFVLNSNDAAIIADLMLGGDGKTDSEELNDIHMSAVQEAMNQMMGTAATSMSTVFSKRVDISPPSIMMLDVKEEKNNQYIPVDDVLVKVSFQLKIGDLIDSNIMQILPITFAKEMVDGLLNFSQEQEVAPSPTVETQKQNTQQEKEPVQAPVNNQESQKRNEPKNLGESAQQNAAVQTASFSTFDPVDLPQSEKRNLDMLMDIPLQVTVELGRTKRTVKDILELSSGSIIELDKLAGEPVDIHVNNKLIAQGEVVVIDENFGVRVTDIVSQSDRLKKLR